jgi:hypothetical protein
MSTAPSTWRVHPAANLFPMLPDEELRTLGNDIVKNGLRTPLALYDDGDTVPVVLDGRNRLEAVIRAAIDDIEKDALLKGMLHGGRPGVPSPRKYGAADDPFAIVASLNIRRRHLTPKQRRDLTAKLLKEHPERSDRQTAKLAQVDNKTVAAVRKRLEAREEIPHVEVRTDTKGRKQPTKPATAPHPDPSVKGEVSEETDGDPQVDAVLSAYSALNRSQRLQFQHNAKLTLLVWENAYYKTQAALDAAIVRAESAEKARDELLAVAPGTPG